MQLALHVRLTGYNQQGPLPEGWGEARPERQKTRLGFPWGWGEGTLSGMPQLCS